MTDREYESEPVPGLPERLPQGETILWQGAPDIANVARRVLYADVAAVYFGLLAASSAVSSAMSGGTAADALNASVRFLIVGAVALGIIVLLARAIARTTLYTVTTRRVVMRFGVAMPMTLNIPFGEIASADVKLMARGTGDIALKAADQLPVTYLHLWPHVRGLRLKAPEPTLRAVPKAQTVSTLLAQAIVASGVPGASRTPATPQTYTASRVEGGVTAVA